jgi:hypothetical protein
MKQILHIILLIGLCISCNQTTDKAETIETDKAKTIGVSDSLELAPQDDYSASAIYRSLDSDSLLTDKGEIDSLLSIFLRTGKQIKRKEYGGGDCEGAYRTFSIKDDNSILTIDKYDCGDFGFGNSQYLTKNDSVLLTREFKVEWYNRTVYTVTERIIKFDNATTILKERETSTSNLGILRFKGQQFKESKLVSNDEEYLRIKRELVDKGRVEQ